MRYLSTLFVAIGFLVAVVVSSTVTQAEADISNVIAQATSYSNAITSLPSSGASLSNALLVHTDASNLATAINQLITDLKGLPQPINEDDGREMITNIQSYPPVIMGALAAIVSKQPVFAGLPIGGLPALIKQDLITLNTSNSNFETIILATFPLTCHTTSVDAAFTAAIAAFS